MQCINKSIKYKMNHILRNIKNNINNINKLNIVQLNIIGSLCLCVEYLNFLKKKDIKKYYNCMITYFNNNKHETK